MPKLWRKPFDAGEKACAPGEVTIEKEKCKGCSYCVQFCPRQVLIMGDQINSKGYTFAKTADGKVCLGCGLCEIMCPEFAVKVACQNPSG
jgi:2-oxoglutarate ferredoxin oxidoreductase subunit delta